MTATADMLFDACYEVCCEFPYNTTVKENGGHWEIKVTHPILRHPQTSTVRVYFCADGVVRVTAQDDALFTKEFEIGDDSDTMLMAAQAVAEVLDENGMWINGLPFAWYISAMVKILVIMRRFVARKSTFKEIKKTLKEVTMGNKLRK